MFKMENVMDCYHMLGIYTVLMVFISGFVHKIFLFPPLLQSC